MTTRQRANRVSRAACAALAIGLSFSSLAGTTWYIQQCKKGDTAPAGWNFIPFHGDNANTSRVPARYANLVDSEGNATSVDLFVIYPANYYYASPAEFTGQAAAFEAGRAAVSASYRMASTADPLLVAVYGSQGSGGRKFRYPCLRARLEGLDPAKLTVSARLAYTGGSLEEVGDFFKFDIGDRSGEVEGEMWLEGPLGDSFKSGLCGGGRLKAANGHLAQMRLFMGLTELLAKEVPGIDRIVNQSEASCTYTVENGVVRTRDVLIEGSLFSIYADGQYDMAKDDLDFMVRVQLMKDESLLGKYLIRPIMWPFTKLLLEFRVRGPIDDPDWDYITVLDRIK